MRYPSLLSLTLLLLLSGPAQTLRADERVVYYAEPTGDSDNFFRRVGQFFHDLFPAEQNLSPHATPPQPTAPRYNLDLPPPGTGYSYRPDTTHHTTVSAAEQKSVHSTEQSRAAAHSAASKSNVVKHDVTSTEAAEHTEPVKPKKKVKAPESQVDTGSETTVTTTTTTKSSPKVTTTTDTTSILTGTRTSKTTRVKSPYPPYNELDVSGLPSGSLAQDPTTQKIFRVP
jgi:hypothetical protein